MIYMPMKGIDDFVWVLAIALVLVVIFMAVAAVVPFNPAIPANQTANLTIPAGAIATFSQLGFVGYSSSYTGQTSSFGSFAVGQPQTDNLKKAAQLDICAGIWCNRQQELPVSVPAYYMDTIRGVKISFAVYDTNQYGDLVVKWNGKEFHRGRSAPQDYLITIDGEYVKDSNTLQVYADGPGLMFWASTIYTLRDFRADVEYGPAHINTFTLSQSELSAWNGGELSFYGSGGPGQLRIRSNGYVVYQDAPSGQVSIPLNYSNANPRLGENLIVFDAIGGGVFSLSNVQLRLYLMTNQIVKSKTFQLSAADYDNLGQGRITFIVNSVQRDGEMTIRLNGKSLSVPSPSVGTNIVYFTSAEAAQGSNTLEISGSGYWDIGDMTITI